MTVKSSISLSPLEEHIRFMQNVAHVSNRGIVDQIDQCYKYSLNIVLLRVFAELNEKINK